MRLKEIFNKKNNTTNDNPLSKSLKNNLDIIKKELTNCDDLIIREFKIFNKFSCALIIIDGLTSGEYIHNMILKTLMVEINNTSSAKEITTAKELFINLQDNLITLIDVKVTMYIEEILDSLLAGNSILLVNDEKKCFIIETKGWEDRGVVEATSQTVIRGPKDSFNETLRTNTMLIRRRIKDKNLRIINKTIGTRSKTEIAILYIEDIVNNKIVDEVHERIDRIKIDGILDSSYVEQLIQDHPYSLFPTVHNTERPDSAVGALFSGYVIIIVDGSSYVLVVPCLLTTLLHTPEDYYHKFQFGTFIRVLRFISLLLALLSPSIYIAITTFHQEILPTELLISITSQREGIPFPAFVEALLMEITFEILREAGVRMPRAIGSAISIVGALVLGEAAVQAGLVSPVMVIVVSLTAISSLIAPSYNLGISIRLLRFLFMILAATLGMFGIITGLMIIGLHLTSIRSFGIPYLYPISPVNKQGLKDSIIRYPLWEITHRPSLLGEDNLLRQKDTTKQTPPSPGQERNR